MNEINDTFVIEHIKELCKQRRWTYYKLSKESNVPYSSLNTMLNKQHIPTIYNLIKICGGFNITLSQFFDGCALFPCVTKHDELFRLWNLLDETSKKLVITYMYGLVKENPLENKELI